MKILCNISLGKYICGMYGICMDAGEVKTVARDLCLRALDTNSACAKSVRRNEDKNEY